MVLNKTNRFLAVLVFGLTLLALFAFGPKAHAATITVNTTTTAATAGNSLCTLREAITNANGNSDTSGGDCTAGSGTDTINFAIPGGGPHVISPTAALPTITGPVIIDGTTQSGASCGTLVTGLPARFGSPHALLIEIDGTSAGLVTTLTLAAGSAGSTIRGLALTNAQNSGFTGGTAISIAGAGHIIECNYIGVRTTGVAAGNESTAISIGTTGSAATIRNNLISGSTASIGIGITGIAGATVTDSVIQGNLIGTNTSGQVSAGYGNFGGVALIGAVSGVDVGGDTAGTGNIIAGNGNGVIAVTFTTSVPDSNPIIGNSIYSNSGGSLSSLGIDLIVDSSGDLVPDSYVGPNANDALDADAGPNDLLNWPVITAATTTGSYATVTFTLDVPAGNHRVEFFGNSAAHASGFGEGQTFLGATTITSNGTGQQAFSYTFSTQSSSLLLTATATQDLGSGSYGSTSEFSAVFTSSHQPPVAAALAETGFSLWQLLTVGLALVLVDSLLVFRPRRRA